jgi:hypothetical protein
MCGVLTPPSPGRTSLVLSSHFQVTQKTLEDIFGVLGVFLFYIYIYIYVYICIYVYDSPFLLGFSVEDYKFCFIVVYLIF